MKKKTSLFKRICCMVLTVVMAASVLYVNPMEVHADYEDGQECWSCDHYHWDEYCCGICGACSAECTSTDCFIATHCNECGACKNESSGFCDECRTCADCHYDNGWHCILCEQCYYINESELCGKCWLCADCRGGLCDTCGFCAECWSNEDDNMHCPECQNCYSAVEQCPNETNNHCVDCCVFCEQCDECLFDEGLELCEDCGLCELCCEIAAEEEDCVCGEYCIESSEWYDHLCMECGVPYCDAEQCETCGLCEECCFSASECDNDPAMCSEDAEYAEHFCEDCGNCFHVDEQCETCGAEGELRCVECCRILTEEAGCDCVGYCFNQSGFEEHINGYHAGGDGGSHDPIPKSEWNMDIDGHWHECRYCIEHGQLDYNPHDLNKYGVCTTCGFDVYAKIIFLKQPGSRVCKVTDHNAYKGEPLNVQDNQVTFSVAAMDQTGKAEFSYQWYYQLNGTDENNWKALEDFMNYWTDPKKDSFSMVSGAQKATLKISVPEDACCTTYYYRCVVTTEIDGELVSAESAPAALRSSHVYKGEYYPIIGEETKILFQPNSKDNIGMRETSIHQHYCIGEGCEEYKEEGHSYSKETKSYINWGPNMYGDWVGDQCEYIEYTCRDCNAKRYVKAHDHYFYDPETGDIDVDFGYENSSHHQLKCLHQGCDKTTREPHVFMAWQSMGSPYDADDGIGSAIKECQLCSYQYTGKPERYEAEAGKNVKADWTKENDLVQVMYGSASADLFQGEEELYITFAPTINDKKEYIKMENPVCEDWFAYYDNFETDTRINVTSDLSFEKISGQPKWKVMFKTSDISKENIALWHNGGGAFVFEPIIDDQECTHWRGTRISGAYDPVCVYDGYTGDKVCEDCGYVVEYGKSIPGGDHHEGELILNPLSKREANCNQRGYTGTSRCTACNKPVPGKSTPRVHKDTYVSGYVAPTCYDFGYSGDYYCSGDDCGELIKEGTLLPPEHQNVSVEGYVAPTKTTNGYSGDLVCNDCGLTIKYGYSLHADRVITEVEIADVEWPTAGSTPCYDVTVEPEAKYQVSKFGAGHINKGVSWTCSNGALDDENVYPYNTFKKGDYYTVRIALEKKGTYAFADDATAIVNGEAATAIVSADGNYLTVEYTFPYTKAAAVSEIAVKVDEPIPGELFTGEVEFNRELLALDEFGVSSVEDGESLNPGYDYFEAGKTYNYYFQFVPLVDASTGWNEACTFADQVTVTVNGKSVKAVHVEPPLPNSAIEYGAVWFDYGEGIAPEIIDPVYALTNVDATLADVAEQLPEGWEWIAPSTKLSPFAGVMEKEFAAKHVNPNTGEVTYDTATVILSTIKNVTLTDMPVKFLSKTEEKVTASYEVLGEPLNEETINKLSWEVRLAPKAKAGIVSVNGIEGDKVTLFANKTGSTKFLIELKMDGVTIASATKTITVVANKAGIAELNVELVDAEGNLISQDNNSFLIKVGDKVYLKNYTASSDVTGNAFKITYKSRDTAIAKIGATDKKDKTKTLLTIGKPGTTVITATANDTLKSSIDIPIKVIDKTAAGVTISATTVTLNTALQNASAELKVYNGFDAQLKSVTCQTNLCGISWKPDGTIILTEKATIGKGGKVKLDVVVSDGVDEVSKTFTITLKKTVKKPTVTVKQLTKLNTFYKNATADLSVGAVGETIRSISIKEESSRYRVKQDGDLWQLYVLDASKADVKKCTLKIRVAGYDDPVEKKITIQKESPKLALSTTSGTVYGKDHNTMKVQLMDNNVKKAMSLSGVNVVVENNTKYEASVDGNHILITAKKIPEKSEKITLKFSSSQWNGSKSFTFTVKTLNLTKAKLQLKNKSLTLYNYKNGIHNSISTILSLSGVNLSSDVLKDVQIVPADSKTKNALNQTLSIAYNKSTGELKVKTIGDGPAKGTYKVNLVLQNDVFVKKITTALTVKVVNVSDLSKCVTVKASGKIDVLNRDGTKVKLTPTFKNLGSNKEVKEYTLTGVDAHLFEIEKITKDVVTIRLKETVNVVTNYNYKVSVNYKIQSGDAQFDITSAPVNIKLVQNTAKVKAKGVNVYSNTVGESKALQFVVTNSMGEKLSIEKVKLINYTKDFNYTFDAKKQTGVLEHQLNGQTARGKSYTLKFELYLEGRGDNVKPVIATFKVNIAK